MTTSKGEQWMLLRAAAARNGQTYATALRIVSNSSYSKDHIRMVGDEREVELTYFIEFSKTYIVGQADIDAAKYQASLNRATLAQIQIDERSGALLSAEKVYNEQFIIGRRLRDRLMSLPYDLSVRLVGKDEQTIRTIIAQALTSTLDEIISQYDKE